MKSRHSALLLLAAAALFGCAGGDRPFDPSLVNPPVGTTFAIAPIAPQTINSGGGTATFPITVTKLLLAQPALARANGDVTLSVTGVPQGFTAAFTTNPVTPTFEGTSTSLVVTLPPVGGAPQTRSLPPTEFTLTITGTDGVSTKSVDTTLTVTMNTTFSIDQVANQTVPPGGTAEFPVTVREVIGNGPLTRVTDPVTISVVDLDPNLSAEITVNPVNPTPEGAVTIVRVFTADIDGPLRRLLGRGQSPSTFTITIRGTNGFRTETRTATLTIENQGS